MTTKRRYTAAEFCLWVGAATAAAVAALGVLAFLVGGGLLSLKFYLFVVGILVFGVGSLGIQPKRPARDSTLTTVDDGDASSERPLLSRDADGRKRNGQLVTFESDDRTRFEERISALPPLRGRYVPMDDRVSRDVKIFTTGVVLLGISLAMEVVFGVTPG